MLVNEIRLLNPGDDIRYGVSKHSIYSDRERLRLPNGYYYLDNGVISNGLINYSVNSIDNCSDRLYPSIDVYEPLKDYSLDTVSARIQALNPDIRVKLVNPIIGNISKDMIFIDIDLNDLVLPFGFYCDNNTISTNIISKYKGIFVDDINNFSDIFLINTSYNVEEEIDKQIKEDMKRKRKKSLSLTKDRM